MSYIQSRYGRLHHRRHHVIQYPLGPSTATRQGTWSIHCLQDFLSFDVLDQRLVASLHSIMPELASPVEFSASWCQPQNDTPLVSNSFATLFNTSMWLFSHRECVSLCKYFHARLERHGRQRDSRKAEIRLAILFPVSVIEHIPT